MIKASLDPSALASNAASVTLLAPPTLAQSDKAEPHRFDATLDAALETGFGGQADTGEAAIATTTGDELPHQGTSLPQTPTRVTVSNLAVVREGSSGTLTPQGPGIDNAVFSDGAGRAPAPMAAQVSEGTKRAHSFRVEPSRADGGVVKTHADSSEQQSEALLASPVRPHSSGETEIAADLAGADSEQLLHDPAAAPVRTPPKLTNAAPAPSPLLLQPGIRVPRAQPVPSDSKPSGSTSAQAAPPAIATVDATPKGTAGAIPASAPDHPLAPVTREPAPAAPQAQPLPPTTGVESTVPPSPPLATAQPASATSTPAIDPRGDMRLAPQIEAAIEQLADARQTARTARPEIMLKHGEFGIVSMRLDAASGDLRATLAARDPGFVAAVQSALAERAVAASQETLTGQRGHDQPPSGAGLNASGNPFAQNYGSSPGSSQGSSQPRMHHHEDAASERETSASEHSASDPSAADGADGVFA